MPKGISKRRAEYSLAYAQELYDDAQSAWVTKRAYKTIEAMAFFRGYQYTLTAPRPTLQNQVDQRDEATEVVNICRPLVNSHVASLLSQIPTPQAAPMKNDPKAQARTRMAENLAFSFARNGVIDMFELRECVTWATITGAAWMKDYWDPNAGRHMPDTMKTGLEDDPDEDDEAPVNANMLREGEAATEFVSTLDCLPDPAARSPKEIGYIVHRKIRPIGFLNSQFPVDYNGERTTGRWDMGIRSAEQATMRNIVEDEDSAMGSAGLVQRGDRNILSELCEMWMLPNREYPFGLLLIWSGTMILYVGKNPLMPMRLPFTLFLGPNKTPGTLYADGLLDDIKHLQRVVNQVESKKIEIIGKMANPHLLVPNGSGIEQNTWGNIPGQVIPYNKGYGPTRLDPSEVPASMFQHTNDQVERSKFLVGHSDLAAGSVGAEASGRTVAFATENTQQSRAPEIVAHRNSMIQVMNNCLHVAHQRYDEGRFVRVLGPENKLETQVFFANDYDFENEFVLEPYSDEPLTHQGRLSTAVELNNSNFFGDDPASERLRRFVGGTYSRRSAYDPFQSDRDRARREHLYVLDDPMNIPGVKTFDIHRIHLEEHNEFRKSSQYEQLPPQVQAMFDQHCEIHEALDRAAKMMQNMGGETENILGPPPGQGQPSGQMPGSPSPPDGGASGAPAPPPTISQFNQMSESEQRSSDQA